MWGGRHCRKGEESEGRDDIETGIEGELLVRYITKLTTIITLSYSWYQNISSPSCYQPFFYTQLFLHAPAHFVMSYMQFLKPHMLLLSSFSIDVFSFVLPTRRYSFKIESLKMRVSPQLYASTFSKNTLVTSCSNTEPTKVLERTVQNRLCYPA